jgi:hypothetical protein
MGSASLPSSSSSRTAALNILKVSTAIPYSTCGEFVGLIPHWALPAVRDLTRDGRLSTYDESVLKLSKVSFREKCARSGHLLKLQSPTKLARLGHFPPASQVGRLAGTVFYVYIFYLVVLSGCTHCVPQNRSRVHCAYYLPQHQEHSQLR